MKREPNLDVLHTDRPGIRKVLGDLEAEIMEIIWAQQSIIGITVREVFEILYTRRRIAYTTVMSTMARLAKKKLLRAEKVEQAYIYRPSSTQEQFIARLVGHVLDNLLVGFSEATLDHVQSLADPTTDQHIQRMLEEIRRRRAEEDSD